jgi:hypothetical protein
MTITNYCECAVATISPVSELIFFRGAAIGIGLALASNIEVRVNKGGQDLALFVSSICLGYGKRLICDHFV